MKMEDKIKIATWNLCLGLSSKKDYVSQIILNEAIDVCCMQEVDLKKDINADLLSVKGYSLIVENNEGKARAGMYIKNGINYQRKADLEGLNNSLIIVDLNLKRRNYRLING